MEEDAAQAETAAQMAAAKAKIAVRSFERRKPARRPLPEHLPRERIVYPAPAGCPCCGGTLHKIGEDVTETLELVPRQWKVIQHVREKFSCRACESITQPPAPSHPIARGRAGPSLLAHVLFEVLPAPAAQSPEHGLCARRHRARRLDPCRLGRRLCGNPDADGAFDPRPRVCGRAYPCRRHHCASASQEQVPHGRLWTYVRDDRPFGGPAAPAAALFYSPDRGGEHPEQHLANYAGLMQADAYAGFNKLYQAGRKPGPIVEAACWAHARRKFRLGTAAESADRHRGSRLCMSNNAAERTLRCVAVGRHNWTFAGSDEGGRAAAIYTLIETAKLNDLDPQVWLAHLLARLPDHPAKRISELLPWNWRPPPRLR